MREVTLHCDVCQKGYTTVRTAGEGTADVIRGKCLEHRQGPMIEVYEGTLGRSLGKVPEVPEYRFASIAAEIRQAISGLADLAPFPPGEKFVDASIITGPKLASVLGHLEAAQKLCHAGLDAAVAER